MRFSVLQSEPYGKGPRNHNAKDSRQDHLPLHREVSLDGPEAAGSGPGGRRDRYVNHAESPLGWLHSGGTFNARQSTPASSCVLTGGEPAAPGVTCAGGARRAGTPAPRATRSERRGSTQAPLRRPRCLSPGRPQRGICGGSFAAGGGCATPKARSAGGALGARWSGLRSTCCGSHRSRFKEKRTAAPGEARPKSLVAVGR